MSITVKQIDPFSTDVYDFRREIIVGDEKSSEVYLRKDIDRHNDMPEEVWKYSLRKWNSINLSALHGVYIDNELACISGSRIYGKKHNFLRTGMHYYVLKRFRKQCRSWLWKPDGLIETALKDYKNLDYSFVSIYPHNSRLASWCKALQRGKRFGQIGNGSEHLSLLSSYCMKKEPIRFKGVEQFILYRRENNTSNSYTDFVHEIQDSESVK